MRKKAFENAILHYDVKNQFIDISTQIYLFPTAEINEAVMAYDMKECKYVCDLSEDQMRQRERYILYGCEYDNFKRYRCYMNLIPQLVDDFNQS